MEMSSKEIVRVYRQTKDLRQAVIDLAQKNKTTPDVIQDILRRNGYAPPDVMPRPGATVDLTRSTHLIELVEQGTPVPEIADALGVSYGQALTWVARLCCLCEEYIAAAEGGAPV